MKTLPRLRVRERGAVFVESIIVVSFFTLCFLGVIYFKELYVEKLRVQRLARASAMAFAMSSCKADPKAGLENDIPKDPANNQQPPPTPGGPGTGTDSDTDPNSKNVLDSLGRSQGGAPLADTTKISLKSTAAGVTRKDAASPEQGFRSDVTSTSTVTCMDEVSDDTTTEILPKVESIFGSLM